jgi:hypothetical protein
MNQTNQLKQLVIVLSASCYIIANDKTGEVENQGCGVRFLYTPDMLPCVGDDLARPSAGYKPGKANVPIERFSDFKVVPGLFEATLDFSVSSDGKAVIKAKDFQFVSGITVSRTTAANAKGGSGFSMTEKTS